MNRDFIIASEARWRGPCRPVPRALGPLGLGLPDRASEWKRIRPKQARRRGPPVEGEDDDDDNDAHAGQGPTADNLQGLLFLH